MVHFLGLLVPDYVFIGPLYGFTVSEVSFGNPRINAYLRLPEAYRSPRILHCFCQGIHHAPLVA